MVHCTRLVERSGGVVLVNGAVGRLPSDQAWACTSPAFSQLHCITSAGCCRDAGQHGDRWTVAYLCMMRVCFMDTHGTIISWHEDVGYGTAEKQPRVDAAVEQACKSAVTDARKRALRLFGPALGAHINSEVFQKEAAKMKQNNAQQAQQLAQQQRQQGQLQHQGAGGHGGAGASAGAGSSYAGAGSSGSSGFAASSVPAASASASTMQHHGHPMAASAAASSSVASAAGSGSSSSSSSASMLPVPMQVGGPPSGFMPQQQQLQQQVALQHYQPSAASSVAPGAPLAAPTVQINLSAAPAVPAVHPAGAVLPVTSAAASGATGNPAAASATAAASAGSSSTAPSSSGGQSAAPASTAVGAVGGGGKSKAQIMAAKATIPPLNVISASDPPEVQEKKRRNEANRQNALDRQLAAMSGGAGTGAGSASSSAPSSAASAGSAHALEGQASAEPAAKRHQPAHPGQAYGQGAGSAAAPLPLSSSASPASSFPSTTVPTVSSRSQPGMQALAGIGSSSGGGSTPGRAQATAAAALAGSGASAAAPAPAGLLNPNQPPPTAFGAGLGGLLPPAFQAPFVPSFSSGSSNSVAGAGNSNGIAGFGAPGGHGAAPAAASGAYASATGPQVMDPPPVPAHVMHMTHYQQAAGTGSMSANSNGTSGAASYGGSAATATSAGSNHYADHPQQHQQIHQGYAHGSNANPSASGKPLGAMSSNFINTGAGGHGAHPGQGQGQQQAALASGINSGKQHQQQPFRPAAVPQQQQYN